MEIEGMQENSFSIWSDNLFKCIDRLSAETACIHKVHDHFDLLLNIKMTECLFPQVMGNSGNGIAFINRERYNGGIGLISSNQCYIRSVKRSNDRNKFS